MNDYVLKFKFLVANTRVSFIFARLRIYHRIGKTNRNDKQIKYFNSKRRLFAWRRRCVYQLQFEFSRRHVTTLARQLF